MSKFTSVAVLAHTHILSFFSLLMPHGRIKRRQNEAE